MKKNRSCRRENFFNFAPFRQNPFFSFRFYYSLLRQRQHNRKLSLNITSKLRTQTASNHYLTTQRNAAIMYLFPLVILSPECSWLP